MFIFKYKFITYVLIIIYKEFPIPTTTMDSIMSAMPNKNVLNVFLVTPVHSLR